jgi:hypothetical protein
MVRVILKLNILKMLETVAWTCMAHDRVQWRDLVNTVMEIWVEYKACDLLTG